MFRVRGTGIAWDSDGNKDLGPVTEDTLSTSGACPFCSPPPQRIFLEGRHAIGMWDAFPVSPGHALLIPRRHVATWFDASPEEKSALIEFIDRAKELIDKRHSPDGYNIGINAGAAAGQTIFHLHVHVIPRYHGDLPDPRGGVRHVIPGRGNYLVDGVADAAGSYREELPKLLVTGGEDPLRLHLAHHLARAEKVDVVVAFVKPSGLEELWSDLTEALERGAQLRILTGDYLGITDPDALVKILDLKECAGRRVALRVFNTAPGSPLLPRAFHPKAYVFGHRNGSGAAFVGSSNLSRSALSDGVEWNYQIIASRDAAGFRAICRAYDQLFADPATTELTPEWIDKYRVRRPALQRTATVAGEIPLEIPNEPPAEVPEPHGVQREALEKLEEARVSGATKGLVVLATGLGKTWLSAFDSAQFGRVLFVAHREEILNQALETYRNIRPGEYLGTYHGTEQHPEARVIFASVQTLSRKNHLERFAPDHFDYIVVDEFHHASAATYRRLIHYFQPKFLLGLTATPERSDGGDLLDLCDGNLIYRCDLPEGIRRGLLCPFSYYGVPDEVDYTNIPWRSTRFDEEKLTSAVATHSRARNALEQLEARGGKRTVAFCVSQRHANFMAGFFSDNGKRAVAVHSGAGSASRAESLRQLQAGELDVVCAVDMFNEGVDLPELDTIMMLRPTESKILWLQQFGRGLRKGNAAKRLTVIDYIGNHRTFLLKPRTLFDLPSHDSAIQNLLEQLRAGTAKLPPGCEVTYDLEAIEILRNLLRTGRSPAEALRAYVNDFRDLHGVRPTALEAYRDQYNPRAARANFGSWFKFLESVGLLEVNEVAARTAGEGILEALEITPMAKSFKMVVLLAMLNEDAFSNALSIDALVTAVRRFAKDHASVRADFGDAIETDAKLRSHLESNPIKAWTGGAGTGGKPYFAYTDGVFSSLVEIGDEQRPAIQIMIREIAEWRLAEYLDRPTTPTEEGCVIKVNHSGGRPILFPLNRNVHTDLPRGWTDVMARGQLHTANFVERAVNVVRRAGSEDNVIASLLRGWFGPDAGAPGTRHHVRLRRGDAGEWTLEPVGAGVLTPFLWKQYAREQIPPLFGLDFNRSVWQQGFVRRDKQTFLLVTLDKSAAVESQRYEDHFLSPSTFQWQSQNRTRRDSKDGESIRDHVGLGIHIHLFVRARSKLRNGTAAPFTYCGEVDFVDWERDNPITVTCRLREPVPDRLRRELRVPEVQPASDQSQHDE
jgi:superfamily II DNA or RNA helicase/diadenosine tetraphosphate (Ap4A) HIT family hydrolase/HKD family nuclease